MTRGRRSYKRALQPEQPKVDPDVARFAAAVAREKAEAKAAKRAARDERRHAEEHARLVAAKDAAAAAKVSPRFGAALSNELLPCAYLPASSYEPHAVSAPGAPPILVVGSTGDVATPYEQAVAVARRLERGVLLTVELEGHIAIGASDCADEAIARYLVDGVPPPAGTRC